MRNIKAIVFLAGVLFFQSAASAQEVHALPVGQFCQSYSGQSDFVEDLFQKTLRIRQRRVELVYLLKNHKAPGCRQALADYFNRYIDNPKKDFTQDTKFDAILSLAMTVELPEAVTLIEREINGGRLVEWLDVFEKSDKKLYFQTLSHWVELVASVLRKLDHASLVDSKAYGKNTEIDDKISTPEAVPIWNPMFINRYFTYTRDEKIKLNLSKFSDLNIIYAASNQSYREIFLPRMRDVIALNEVEWMTSFRQEPLWVQFRLFPIMGKLGDGIVKRELIWLSQYHQNFKLRSLAQSTLDKINDIKRLP